MLRLVSILCLFSFSVHAQNFILPSKNYKVVVKPAVEAAEWYLDTSAGIVMIGGVMDVKSSGFGSHGCTSPAVAYICTFADGDTAVSPILYLKDLYWVGIFLKGIDEDLRKSNMFEGWFADDKLLTKMLNKPLVSISVNYVVYKIVDGNKQGAPEYIPAYTFFLGNAESIELNKDIRAAVASN